MAAGRGGLMLVWAAAALACGYLMLAHTDVTSSGSGRKHHRRS